MQDFRFEEAKGEILVEQAAVALGLDNPPRPAISFLLPAEQLKRSKISV